MTGSASRTDERSCAGRCMQDAKRLATPSKGAGQEGVVP